jgi:sterol desaturase/sphingolipid hydroxylase (fatty acid hydroxylase superfamily)
VILFHHSNIHMPGWLDKPLRAVIVTPWIHQVHHSRLQPETDSNYSSLFSWWDRLAKTLKFRSDLRTIDQGLDGWDHPRHLSLWGMMKTPFRRK